MVYPSFTKYSILNLISMKSRCYYCLSNIYIENIFELKYPKVIHYISVKSFNSSTSLNDINNVVSGIVNVKQNKFDKKYKSSAHNKDILETKKNKNKLIKKNRKVSNDVSKDDLFVENQDEFFIQESLKSSLVKTNKFNKNKKKDKNKFEDINNTQSVIKSLNLDSYLDKSNLNDQSKTTMIDFPLTIQELSNKLKIPEAEIITYLFLKKGISVTMNQVIDISTAQEIALSYNFNILKQSINYKPNVTSQNYKINSSSNVRRAPIITILGHVDHGKTTLLDSILKTNVVKEESGGITQSICGYEIDYNYLSEIYKLVFLDTPGHEAFKSMRVRGAKVTDIALLIVAADDGLKPQTIEAIKYILEMDLSYIVVINKIDKLEKDISRIKKDLASYNIIPEDLGGSASVIEVSALTGQNIDLLLSKICLLSQKQDLFININMSAHGFILESYLDKKQGCIANILIQNGILKVGDIIVSSNVYGKIKSITDLNGRKIQSSSASSIVQILGFSIVPQAGRSFKIMDSERAAKKYCLNYINDPIIDYSLKLLNNRVIISNNKNIKQFKLIVKADTQGSLEAITNLFAQIPQNKVQIYIINANFNSISNTDIELSLATNSSIISFNLSITSQIMNLIKKNKIIYKNFNVIYDLLDYVKGCMLDLIDPEYDKTFIGSATVQTVFNMNKGSVAGCIVNEGKLKKMSYIHIHRNNKIVYEGLLTSLKRMKDNVEEVLIANECGVMCDYSSWEAFDIISSYELIPKNKSL